MVFCVARRWIGGTVLVLSSALALGQSLPDLESVAQTSAPAIRLAQAQVLQQRYRLDEVQALRGPRWMAGAGVSDVREPVSTTASNGYRRANAQVGLRWPLFDSALAQDRALLDAQTALTAASLQARQAEIDVVRELRIAYIDHLYSARRAELSRALLTQERSVREVLDARAGQSLLLEADRRELLYSFELGRRDEMRATAQRHEALLRVRRLSGQELAVPDMVAPWWDLHCRRLDDLQAGTDQRPQVLAAENAVAHRRALVQQQHSSAEGGIALARNFSRDAGGLPGRSIALALEISLPLDWRGLRSARQAQAQGELERASMELQDARALDRAAVERAWQEVEVRMTDYRAALSRVDAAREALRVAIRREQHLSGEVFERRIHAQHALYVVAVEISEAEQRLASAQANVLAFAQPCETSPQRSAESSLQWNRLLGEVAQAAPLPQGATGAADARETPANGESVGAPPESANVVAPGLKGATGLGWFVWRAAPWLEDPQVALDRLPPGTDRILLGLDASQMRELANPAGSRSLRTLVQEAHVRNVRVHLLLGEPAWILPAGRAKLLALLRPLSHLPFDGLFLDLERSQLAAAQQRLWTTGTVKTMAAVRSIWPLPIALVTHDRDLVNARFFAQLKASGVSELVPMIYVTNRQEALKRLRRVVRASAGLKVSMAQSVERELPASSSLHAAGRVQALRHAQVLASDLRREFPVKSGQASRFGGVLLQSFEDFLAAPP